MPAFKASLTESLTRKQYWLVIGGLMLVMIVLCAWWGWYHVDDGPDDVAGDQVRSSDPLTAMLYNPLGNAVVLAVGQFIVANLVLWSVLWVARRVAGARGSERG